MQNNKKGVTIKYIIITQEISFIQNNIVDCCKILHIPRPTKTMYGKCSKVKMTNIILSDITNIKSIEKTKKPNISFYCERVIYCIKDYDNIKFSQLREYLYDMLIMNLDIAECFWYILKKLITDGTIKESKISDILSKTYIVLQRFNNNYRPIMHLESFIFILINNIYGSTDGTNYITASPSF